MKRTIGCLLILAILSGCGPSKRDQLKKVDGTWSPAAVSHVRVQMQPLGEVANNGLLLPTASPDGKWIAYLQYRGDSPPAADSLWSGKNLAGMSLSLRETTEGSEPRVVCPSGAIWPAWSWDGKQLAYVIHTDDGKCLLGLYDIATGKNQRLNVGCKGMMTLSFSSKGDAIAFIAEGQTSGKSRLYVLTLADQKLTPCSTAQLSESQHWPTWTHDGRIIYLRQSPSFSELAHWKPEVFPPEPLLSIPIPNTPMGRFQSFAGLGRPLSPDDQRFAYYDALVDRIVLLELRDGDKTRVELKPGTRAGCWFDPKQYVAATDKELRLFTDAENSALLMRGSWLPRECVQKTHELILCTRGAHRHEFNMVKMLIDAAK